MSWNSAAYNKKLGQEDKGQQRIDGGWRGRSTDDTTRETAGSVFDISPSVRIHVLFTKGLIPQEKKR